MDCISNCCFVLFIILGTRYILTGFCSYNIERPTHASYMSTYDKRWDGKLNICLLAMRIV